MIQNVIIRRVYLVTSGFPLDVTLRVTISKTKKLSKKFYFESLTLRLNFFCSFFELLTRSQKIKIYTLGYYLELRKY